MFPHGPPGEPVSILLKSGEVAAQPRWQILLRSSFRSKQGCFVASYVPRLHRRAP